MTYDPFADFLPKEMERRIKEEVKAKMAAYGVTWKDWKKKVSLFSFYFILSLFLFFSFSIYLSLFLSISLSPLSQDVTFEDLSLLSSSRSSFLLLQSDVISPEGCFLSAT